MTASYSAIILAALLAGSFLLAACDSGPEETGVHVVAYDGPPITEALAKLDGRSWTAKIDAGQVVLEEHTLDQDSVHVRLFLVDVPGALPTYTGSALLLQDAGPVYRLLRGTIAIDSWDLGGVLSGEIRSEIGSPPRNYGGAQLERFFYVDLSEQ